jgi:murein L,D-transpeptidase YcbB/YkuD
MRPFRGIATGVLLAGVSGLALAAHAGEGPAADELRAALGSDSIRRVDGYPLRGNVLRAFYSLDGFEPVWGPDPEGTARAASALEALLGACYHGLAPAHYEVAALRRRASPSTAEAAVERELLLTDALLRYAVDLRAGRLRPPAVRLDWGIRPPERDDPVRELADAIEAGTLSTWLEALPPPHEGYARLVAALRLLHATAEGGGPGASPAAARIRQIAVNLERWRWLPRRHTR